MQKYIILTILFSWLHIAARGQTIASLDDIDLSGLPQPTQAKALRYWFDDNNGSIKTVSQLSGQQTIDVSSLLNGLHTLHYQVVDENNHAYHIVSGIFMKMEDNVAGQVTARNLIYWFDDETDVKSINIEEGVQALDASHLLDGLHTIHYQVLCSNGQMTAAQSSVFMRISTDTESIAAKSLRYWFDDQLTATETEVINGMHLFDASQLKDGLHTIHYQVKDSKDVLSTPVSSIFMKMEATAGMTANSLRYWFDDNAATMQVAEVGNGSQILDVSELQTGIHTLHYQLIDSKGKIGTPVTGIFMKNYEKVIADSENRISEYQYWLNDNCQAMQKVALNSASNPYTLISLLPLQKEPIRSQLFHFEITDGQPTVYAKNEFHIRFHDAAGYFVDDFKTYIDYSMKQTLTDLEMLESGSRVTTAKPVDNNIKWYSVTAEPGDSLQFRLDRTATVQLFAPSGEELLSTSGSNVVNWFGCHVRESGTFYMALHDVTATWGDDISIEYNHIDKYAVLRQDVSVVGDGGRSTITFEGNGFDELEEVCLIMGTNIINALDITHKSNATTSVTFDFSGVTLGQYKAVFHFTDAEIMIENCIKLEEAKEIDIEMEINYASTYLRGTYNPYHISLENKGNMTAYNVPIIIGTFEQNDGTISSIMVEGYSLSEEYDTAWKNNLSKTLYDSLRNSTSEHGDMCYFLNVDNSTDMKDYPFAKFTSLFPSIPPYTTLQLHVSIKSTQTAMLYVWVANPDQPIPTARQTQLKKALPKWKCEREIKQRAECLKKNVKNPSYAGTSDFYQPTSACSSVPPECGGGGGPTTPVSSLDPNDIYGYTATSGSHAVKDELTDVYYRIEFENDPEFATAAAHDIYLTDTLNASKFDLSTFAPTRIKIGDKSAELTGEKNFVTTIDMRPEINAIAQIEGTFDEQTGIARWHISSLDPMTMEPTQYVMDGVLPVNTDGRGIGEVMYDIQLKPGLVHGTEVNNRAGIVFDNNDVIMTPTWTNVIDRIAPVSHITSVEQVEDSETGTVTIEATDELSGPWRYDVYVQYGSGAWFKAAENVAVGTAATVKLYEGVEHHFYCVATDMAGNVEQKEPETETSLSVAEVTRKGDVNGNGGVDIGDAVSIVNYLVGKESTTFMEKAADTNKNGQIDIGDAVTIVNFLVGKTESLSRQANVDMDEKEPQ